MRGFLFVLAAVLAVSAAYACPTVTSTNTQDFLNEIPSINTELQTCPLPLGGLSWILKNPTKIDIQMNDGTTESLMVTIQNKQVTGVSRGASACSKSVVTSEAVVDSILGSSNKAGAALFVFQNKGFVIKGCTIWTKFSSWFVNPIGRFAAAKAAPPQMPPPQPAPAPQPTQVQGPTGKPDYCDDTYLPGHRDYANNKALWDSYSANTDAVCQSQYGRGVPSPCVHTVQLSVSGNPYYLCWYNR